MIEVTCMCGFAARGTEDQVVEAIYHHGETEHDGGSSREKILELAVPVEDRAD